MIYKAYKIAIVYFALFSLLLLFTIVALFQEKIGLSINEISSYYSEKSIEGLLEIAIPHFMTIGLFIMVLSHFFLFTQYKKIKKIVALYYLIAFVSLLSPFIKLYTLKIVSLLLFILITFFLTLLLFIKALSCDNFCHKKFRT